MAISQKKHQVHIALIGYPTAEVLNTIILE